MTDVHLDPASVEAIARRVSELLREEPGAGLIDAAEVARRFRLSRAYVYENADALGAIRIGTGKRPRLRFEPETVAERLTARSGSRGSESGKPARKARSKPRRRPRSDSAPGLLPIRGRRDS